MSLTVTDLLARRKEIQAELEAGRLHVLSILRMPPEEMRWAPIGDVLCWAGLAEQDTTCLLGALGMAWSERIGHLPSREINRVCTRIKRQYPATWEEWRKRR